MAVSARVSQEEWAAELVELGRAFRGVFRSLNRLRGRDTHLGGTELSHAQCELLFELEEHGELSAGELAVAAQLTPATVTQMLEHLARAGHVERARQERDKRVVVSRLTPHGRQAIEAKREKWQGRWEQALADVDAEELRAATRVLTRLRAVFEGGASDLVQDGASDSVPTDPSDPVSPIRSERLCGEAPAPRLRGDRGGQPMAKPLL
ncbi:MAG TPA: MarR family transcriptional regulator [Solirubrobacteraceae bacterium]|jgi:DNA-binding MarR family transcriptional regulator|nr:MarR family transcriptional regulator [Solirubrobacteraceae bacterium]